MTGLEKMGLFLKDVSIDERTAIITDWNIRSEKDLPNMLPGHEQECVIAPQTFVVLRKILVGDYLALVRLEIGAVREVPFEMEPSLSYQRSYRLKGLDDEALKKSLLMVGAAVATKDTIALAPGLEVRMLLRNDRGITTKLRAGLFVQEEKTR